MGYAKFLFGTLVLISALSAAAPHDILLPSVVPQNQNLTTVDYLRDGRQSGCGLRITGETLDDIWINVLITVFMKESGEDFGVVKIVARKVEMAGGKPLLRDGRISYVDIGPVRRAWIKPDMREQPVVYESGGPSHTDAYMATVDFADTMDLVVAISQQGFKVGVNRGGGKVDEIYQFDKGLSREEAAKLSVCMNNLRAEIVEYRSRKSF